MKNKDKKKDDAEAIRQEKIDRKRKKEQKRRELQLVKERK
tara:strand:+ start:107 stop:226 length:120 start_codon:yes stop_codon:yes gene_type:complete